MRRVSQRLNAFGSSLKSIGLQATAVGAAIVAPFGLATSQFIKAGDTLEKMALRTGISVESLSELSFAAGMSGTSLETVEKASRKLSQSIFEAINGSKQLEESFALLGISVNEIRDLSPEEQFALIGDALSRVENDTDKAALALRLLGKSGTELFPLFSTGADGLRALTDQAKSLGLTIGTETAQQAALLGDSIDTLKGVVTRTVFEIGAAISGPLITAAQVLTSVAAGVLAFVKETRGLVVGAAAAGVAVLGLGGAILTLAGGFAIASLAASGLAAATGLLATIFGAMVSPLGALALALAGGVGALLTFTDAGSVAIDFFKQKFASVLPVARAVIGGLSDALAGGEVQLAFEILATGIRVVWLETLDFLLEKWGGAASSVLTAFSSFWQTAQSIWAAGASSIRDTFAAAVDTVAKLLLRLQGLFDKSFNVQEAIDALDAESQRESDERRRELADRLNAIAAQADARRESIAGLTNGDAANALRDSIGSSRERLGELRDRAANLDEDGADRIAEKISLAFDSIDEAAGKITTFGSFGSSRLEQSAAGGNLGKQQLDVSRSIAENTQRTAASVDRLANRMSFA